MNINILHSVPPLTKSAISLLAALVCTVPSQQHQGPGATSPPPLPSLAVPAGFPQSSTSVSACLLHTPPSCSRSPLPLP